MSGLASPFHSLAAAHVVLVRPMRPTHIAAFVLFLVASACVGYWSMIPGTLSSAFPRTPSGCLSPFIVIVLICTVALWCARIRGWPFYFPSLRRGFPHPFSVDPLQILFVGSLMAAGMVLGSAVGLLRSSSYGLWGFLLNVSIFLSLLFAQAMNCFLHRPIIKKV
jgi:hypothetical protein